MTDRGAPAPLALKQAAWPTVIRVAGIADYKPSRVHLLQGIGKLASSPGCRPRPAWRKTGCKSIIAFMHMDAAYGKIRANIIMPKRFSVSTSKTGPPPRSTSSTRMLPLFG